MAKTSNARRRLRDGARVTSAAVAALAVCVVGTATAAEGDGAASSSAGSVSAGGGALAPPPPKLHDVICLEGCIGLRKPARGGIVQASGRNLGGVTKMSFRAADGRVLVAVSRVTDTSVQARVPAAARDGRVRLRDDYGNRSELSPLPLDIRQRSELESATGLELAEAEATPRRAYYFGMRMPRLNYVIRSSEPLNDLRIDVVSNRSGEVVKSIFRHEVPPNTTQSLRWGGRTQTGRTAANGGYTFRVSSTAGRRATVSSAGSTTLGFKFFRFIFPVRGRHTYGDGIGAPRAGHTHQGADIFARCGVPLVAARGGKVQYNGYHGSAGYYIVIDGRGTGVDFAYMHLLRRSKFRVGSTVRTGQKIGLVGETGNASGCHLHYEMWSAPGWYEGGTFMDPMPFLRRWDRFS